MSTSSENPVNQISELLTAEPQAPVDDNQDDLLAGEANDESNDDDKTALAGDDNLNDDEPNDSESGSEDGDDGDEGLLADDDGQADEGDVDTLNNLAEELEVEVSDLYALNVKMSEGEPVTLGALKDFYEANRDVDGLRDNITQEREQLAQQGEALKAVPQISDEFLQARAQVLSINDQYNRIDWETLRQQNPGQYAALQTDFQTAFQQAKQAEATVGNKISENDDLQAQFQQERLFRAIPELKDDAFREKSAIAVATLAGKYGFSTDEVADITDSRLMHLLIDVSKGVQAVESARQKKVEKEVKKSGAPSARKHTPGNAGRKATLKKLTDKAKKTGDRRDQVSAVNALIS